MVPKVPAQVKESFQTHHSPRVDGEYFFNNLICTFWGYFKESTNELFNVDIQNLIITN